MIKPCARCGHDFDAKTCAKYCPACRDAAHREVRIECQKRWNAANPEAVKQMQKRNYESHKQQRNEYSRRYQESHRQQCNEYSRRYREKLRLKRKAEQFREKMILRKQLRLQAEAAQPKPQRHWTDELTLYQLSM